MNDIICILPMALITILTSEVPSQEKLEKWITGIHTKTFSVGNLFEAQLDTHEWQDILFKTYNFVKKHSFYHAELKKCYKEIKHADNDLRMILKHASIHTDSDKKKVDTMLNEIKERMFTVQQKLKQQLDGNKFLLHRQEKVAQVLHRLTISVKLNALKAQHDLEKIDYDKIRHTYTSTYNSSQTTRLRS